MVLFRMTEFKQVPRGNFLQIILNMLQRYAHLIEILAGMTTRADGHDGGQCETKGYLSL